MLPKISIITPSLDQGKFLEDTILSVLNQNYPNLDYIIIDGGSTDNSIEIISKYKKKLTYWISEPDKGQTNAINKGFEKATGDIINWINSDDLLAPGSLNCLTKEIRNSPNADFYFGDYRVIDKNGREIFSRKSPPYNFNTLFYGRQLSCQPAVFFKRSLLENIGYLDESFNFCMDTEFWIRAACKGAKFKQVKFYIAITRFHDQAKTTRMQQILHDEHKMVVRRYNSLSFLGKHSKAENIYYTLMNRFWRLAAALKRIVFRKDFSFMMVNRALREISQENK